MALRPSVTIRLPLAQPGQRIGIMGGSFNPPHEGHLIVARTALNRLKLDQLWWLVTPGNPLKAHDGLAPLASRMAGCRRLAGANPRMKVTGFEAELGSAYTAVTLAFLKRRRPDLDFVWVMGADNLAHFHFWQNWRGIMRMMPVAVVDRPAWRFKALASPAAQAMRGQAIPEGCSRRLPAMMPPVWVFLTSKLSSLSSSELRSQRGRGS